MGNPLLSDPFEGTPKQESIKEGTASSVKLTKVDYSEHNPLYGNTNNQKDKCISTIKETRYRKDKKNRGEEYGTTGKKTRLINDKLGFAQSIAYPSSTQCSTANMSLVSEPKTLPRTLFNEHAACTSFSLNPLETLNVLNVSITTTNKFKFIPQESLQTNSMIPLKEAIEGKLDRKDYRVIIKESLEKRRNTGIHIEQFRRKFHERINSINDALAQRYKAEIEHHRNAIRAIPTTISTPRVRFKQQWAKNLIHRHEKIFY